MDVNSNNHHPFLFGDLFSVLFTDVDECVSTERVCKGDHEKCANTVGSYDCVCMKGYIRRGGKCERKQKGEWITGMKTKLNPGLIKIV